MGCLWKLMAYYKYYRSRIMIFLCVVVIGAIHYNDSRNTIKQIYILLNEPFKLVLNNQYVYSIREFSFWGIATGRIVYYVLLGIIAFLIALVIHDTQEKGEIRLYKLYDEVICYCSYIFIGVNIYDLDKFSEYEDLKLITAIIIICFSIKITWLLIKSLMNDFINYIKKLNITNKVCKRKDDHDQESEEKIDAIDKNTHEENEYQFSKGGINIIAIPLHFFYKHIFTAIILFLVLWVKNEGGGHIYFKGGVFLVVLIVRIWYSNHYNSQCNKAVRTFNKHIQIKVSNNNSVVDKGIYSKSELVDSIDKNFLLSMDLSKWKCGNIKNISIANYYYYRGGQQGASVKESSDVFFIIGRDDIDKNLHLILDVVYEEKNKNYIYRMDYIIRVKKYDDLVFPFESKIVNAQYSRLYNGYIIKNMEVDVDVAKFKEVLKPIIINRKYIKELGGNALPATSNAHFLNHNGAFGIGKTTSGVIELCNKGYSPIIISPWEDNLANDFIYSIYKELRRETNIRTSRKLYMQTNIIFWTSYAALLLAATEISEKFFGGFTNLDFRCNLLIILVLYLIYKNVYMRFLDRIIIYKNQFNDFYKRAMVEDIVTMLDNEYSGKYILLIEDIDRLEIEEVRQVFREISFINRCYNQIGKRNKPIGIVSFNKKELERKYSKLRNIPETYIELHKKIFYEEFKTSSYLKDNKEIYINNTCEELKKIGIDICLKGGKGFNKQRYKRSKIYSMRDVKEEINRVISKIEMIE